MAVEPSSHSAPIPGAGSVSDARVLETKIMGKLSELEGKMRKIQPGADEVFATQELVDLGSDIVQLRALLGKGAHSKAGPLFQRLERLQERLIEVYLAPPVPLKGEPPRPLMDARMSLAFIADTYPPATANDPAHVRTGLETLNANFDTRQVLGDGHCLFRGIAVDVAEKLTSASPAENTAFLKHLETSLDTTVKNLKAAGADCTQLEPKVTALKGQLKNLAEGRTSITTLLNTPATSNALVFALRDLASTYNSKFGSDAFKADAIAWYDDMVWHSDNAVLRAAYMAGSISDDEKIAAYLEAIRATDEVGGDVEIFAIANALQLKIGVLNARAVGQGESPLPAHSVFGPEASQNELLLLYRPGHYDSAFRKPPSS